MNIFETAKSMDVFSLIDIVYLVVFIHYKSAKSFI